MKCSPVVFGIGLALVAAGAAGAAALRLPRLDSRPMHADEAEQALKTSELLQSGTYRYDPWEHHGPTLYYLALPVMKLAGVKDFAGMTEFSVRIVPALFGVGLVLFLSLVAKGLGRSATFCAAAATAVSPAMVFFSRYYIQEMLLVFFTFGLIVSAWRYARTQVPGWLLAAGAFGGLMAATKETWILAAAAMAAGLVLATLWTRRVDGAPESARPRLRWWAAPAAVLGGALVAALFYSSFFTNWEGLRDAFRAYGNYFYRAAGAGVAGIHDHPWHYYLAMLLNSRWITGCIGGPWWSEGIILVLALVGIGAALRPRGPGDGDPALLKFLAFYTIALAVIYAAIPYKTPWCALGFLHGMILMAGVGAVALVRWMPARSLRVAMGVLLAILAAHLGWQAYRASFTFAADPRNPYVYAQTSPDVLRLVHLVDDAAAASPGGRRMRIHVITPENYSPLPWYLRQFSRVGYWHEVPDTPDAPVIITSPEVQAAVDARLRGAYHERVLFGLRPGVLVAVVVEDGLWNSLMERRTAGK